MFSALNLFYLTSPPVNTRPENIWSIYSKVPFHPLYVEVILFSLARTYHFLRKKCIAWIKHVKSTLCRKK